MTAPQMVCHLSDSFRVVLGQKAVTPATGPLQRTVIKWIALYVPLAWPAGIVTRPEVDQEAGGTRPGEFERDRAELEALVEVVTMNPRALAGQSHPIFGRMSERAFLRWSYLHMDHHLRQFGA